MNEAPVVSPQRSESWWNRHGPVVCLLLFAPVLSELLSGSTRLSTIFVLIPSTGFWGCAALLIRELVRRRGNAWSLLLLGFALALLEECVVQQTSLAPLIGVPPEHAYGRWYGVNWVYLVWALGFESIWAVVIPVVLTEALFPTRRSELWLGRRGLLMSVAVMTLSGFVAWFAWTQIFLPKFFPKLVYHPPIVAILLALAAIIGLVAAALTPRPQPQDSDTRAPSPGWIFVLVVTAALPWFLIVALAFNALPTLPPLQAIAAAAALAVAAVILGFRWSGARNWRDAHRLAAVAGIVVATLLGGIVTLTLARTRPLDRGAQIAFNLIALGGVAFAARRRTASGTAPGSGESAGADPSGHSNR